MRNILKNRGQLALFVVGAAAVMPLMAHAAGSDEILTTSCSTLQKVRRWAFNIAYILGAIGLVVVAISAFFSRFKVMNLVAIGGGLFIVAMADLVINFATGGKGGTSCSDSYNG